MLSEGLHRVGLQIAREIDLETDATLPDQRQQTAILGRANAVANPRRAQLLYRIPHVRRTACFTGMNRDLPTRIAATPEMIAKQFTRPPRLIARQIKCANFPAVREQRLQFDSTF